MAATSLPAVDRPNADRWNAARSRQYLYRQDCSEEYVGDICLVSVVETHTGHVYSLSDLASVIIVTILSLSLVITVYTFTILASQDNLQSQ